LNRFSKNTDGFGNDMIMTIRDYEPGHRFQDTGPFLYSKKYIMKKLLILISLFSFGLLLTGCFPSQESTPSDTIEISSDVDLSNLSGVIDATLHIMQNKDFLALYELVWSQGLRLSPYQWVTDDDIVLDANQIHYTTANSAVYNRWAYDGTGDPINLPIVQYFERFVRDHDYINAPEVYHNEYFHRGNTLNNSFEYYTWSYLVEYYFPGFNMEYGGMDWRSLTLVFEQTAGQRYLIWIVHGEWTI